jgi:hypothetical protein
MKKLPINHWLITVSLFCIAGMVLAISPSEKHQLDNFKVSTLKGLSGVAVSVKIVRDQETTLPLLKESDLQGEVEIALQSAGVEVLRPASDVGLYVVLVKVFSAGKDDMNCAFHIQSLLLQTVALERNPSIKMDAQTWPLTSHARFGVVSLAITKSMITRTVKDQAKEFGEDYKAANTKTAGDTVSQQPSTNR